MVQPSLETKVSGKHAVSPVFGARDCFGAFVADASPCCFPDSRQSLPLQSTEPGLQVLSWRRSQMKIQRRGEHA
ncbi:hypothetical protein PI124_g9055 [Phytophthora idaei]|nr:hypothetical protein PI124_g9055 [Phytophthora idaei]